MREQLPHVVIVGAGFGGLEASRHLERAPVRLTVIDHYNHHLFQPLLYQVATSVLSPGDITAPIRKVLHGPRTTVLLAEARAVDRRSKRVTLDAGELTYDLLVVATGATHSYFGHPEWAADAPGLKTVDDALEMRRRVLLAFEAAEREENPERRREWLTFVIIGGGPTGVELAGALVDLTHYTLRKEFRRIDTAQSHILLLEGLPRILSAYPEKLSTRARVELERRGVMVRTQALVTGVDPLGVWIGEQRIAARTVLWGAGVAASSLTRSLDTELDRAGRVKVGPTLSLPDDPDVFVIGDAAAVYQNGEMVPGLAPAAKQMGRHTAKNIRRRVRGRPMRPFRYRDVGSFAVVGRGAAIGVLWRNRIRIDGLPAYLLWAWIHVFFLIGFRTRMAVMLEWTYYFFTRHRSVRLITGARKYPLPPVRAASIAASATEEGVPTEPRPPAEKAGPPP